MMLHMGLHCESAISVHQCLFLTVNIYLNLLLDLIIGFILTFFCTVCVLSDNFIVLLE